MKPNLDILLRLFAIVSDSLDAQDAIARALVRDLPVENADADELARFVFAAREILGRKADDVQRPSRRWACVTDLGGEV